MAVSLSSKAEDDSLSRWSLAKFVEFAEGRRHKSSDDWVNRLYGMFRQLGAEGRTQSNGSSNKRPLEDQTVGGHQQKITKMVCFLCFAEVFF